MDQFRSIVAIILQEDFLELRLGLDRVQDMVTAQGSQIAEYLRCT